MKITQTMILAHHLQQQHLSLSSHPVPPLTVHIIHHRDILNQQPLNIIPLSPARKNRAKASWTSFSVFPGILTDSAPPLAQSPDFWNARSPTPQLCSGWWESQVRTVEWQQLPLGIIKTLSRSIRSKKQNSANQIIILSERKTLHQWPLKTDFESPLLMKSLLLQYHYWILTRYFLNFHFSALANII